ncbi:hypothetical protein QTN25_007748 [Entamoeba marina]
MDPRLPPHPFASSAPTRFSNNSNHSLQRSHQLKQEQQRYRAMEEERYLLSRRLSYLEIFPHYRIGAPVDTQQSDSETEIASETEEVDISLQQKVVQETITTENKKDKSQKNKRETKRKPRRTRIPIVDDDVDEVTIHDKRKEELIENENNNKVIETKPKDGETEQESHQPTEEVKVVIGTSQINNYQHEINEKEESDFIIEEISEITKENNDDVVDNRRVNSSRKGESSILQIDGVDSDEMGLVMKELTNIRKSKQHQLTTIPKTTIELVPLDFTNNKTQGKGMIKELPHLDITKEKDIERNYHLKEKHSKWFTFDKKTFPTCILMDFDQIIPKVEFNQNFPLIDNT